MPSLKWKARRMGPNRGRHASTPRHSGQCAPVPPLRPREPRNHTAAFWDTRASRQRAPRGGRGNGCPRRPPQPPRQSPRPQTPSSAIGAATCITGPGVPILTKYRRITTPHTPAERLPNRRGLGWRGMGRNAKRCERAAMVVQCLAQFRVMCSASNLGEARYVSSPVQGASPAQTSAASRPSRVHGHYLRPSTNWPAKGSEIALAPSPQNWT
jgi:hypothetical protein